MNLSRAIFIACAGIILPGCQSCEKRHSGFPVYPEHAAKQCIGGYVRFRYQPDEDRDIRDFEILESFPPGVFDEIMRANVEMHQFKTIPIGEVRKFTFDYWEVEACEPENS